MPMDELRRRWDVKIAPAALIRRLSESTVAWSWAFNFLRLASGVLLLPLLLRQLPKADLGMYYVFLNLSGIVIVLDLGFSPTIGRFVSYAMGGARKLTALGLSDEEPHGTPNYPLLWELLITGRIYYRFLALVTVVLLGTLGSLMVWHKVGETSSVQATWLAWSVCVAAVAAETYFNLWNIFLRNLNQVRAATRISLLAYFVRLVLACVLLLCGAGLLSLPVASLVTSLMIRNLSRRRCLRVLAACPEPARVDWRGHFRTIWPNSWRLGIHFGGTYLSINANVLLCSTVFGLEATASYGLSLQILNIISGMAAVWPQVKWPAIGQLIARRNLEKLRHLFWPRVWLQLGTYVCLAVAAIALGPGLIRFVGSDKEMLPLAWMILLTVNGFLESNCTLWNTFISMWNQLPMLWPSLAANVVGLALNAGFVHLNGAQPGFLVLGPLLAGSVFNYWFWPRYGAKLLYFGLNGAGLQAR
jgi:O-antigen/teichoic acid export membrane protein